ncbi:hypothetical protein K443DRAFT_104828, partial [Laccaria amethystina LaAM-08-1]
LFSDHFTEGSKNFFSQPVADLPIQPPVRLWNPNKILRPPWIECRFICHPAWLFNRCLRVGSEVFLLIGTRGMHRRLPAYGVGRGGGGGGGLPKLKISYIILPFKTSRRWLFIIDCLTTRFLWPERLCKHFVCIISKKAK